MPITFRSVRMPRALVLGALALAPLGAAHAGDADGRYAPKGAGLLPCSAFVEMAQQNAPQAAAVVSWLDGYITGLNMTLDNTYDLVTWQDGVLPNVLASTCSQMPDQPIAVAASQIVQFLGASRLQKAEQPEAITVGERRRVLYPSVVRTMQQALKDNGQTITVDGDFGPGTQNALKAFQTSKGIEATGFPDPRTLVALFVGAGPAGGQAPAPAQPRPQGQPPAQQPLDLSPVPPALGRPQ